MTTSKQFSIMVTQTGCDEERELCQVDSQASAEALAEQTRKKVLVGKNSEGKTYHVNKYHTVRVVDHEAEMTK